MIEQLKQKTEKLSRLLLKELREINEKHRTTQTQKEMTEKEKEITELRKETTGLKEETEKLKQEVESLRTSLSKAAGEKLSDGNPTITDHSDPNRPQKLCEKFNSKCWEFCFECADRQLEMLQEKFVRQEVITEEMNRQFYWKTKGKQQEVLRPYVEACMEICWYAAINDPKLDFSFDPTKNKDDFRGYTKSGKFVDYLVWPAMYLHSEGPLLYIVQLRDSEQERHQIWNLYSILLLKQDNQLNNHVYVSGNK
ncbi:unnamed protein product [Mytilus coruscus]|uniref:Uncharacterized protein n=1 Tax=Mytilus coruscus TaxID=42192 RepID=A0A6J8EKW2_MYTCO|nr:unnamed protein product [Mytilus coruscus]